MGKECVPGYVLSKTSLTLKCLQRAENLSCLFLLLSLAAGTPPFEATAELTYKGRGKAGLGGWGEDFNSRVFLEGEDEKGGALSVRNNWPTQKNR